MFVDVSEVGLDRHVTLHGGITVANLMTTALQLRLDINALSAHSPSPGRLALDSLFTLQPGALWYLPLQLEQTIDAVSIRPAELAASGVSTSGPTTSTSTWSQHVSLQKLLQAAQVTIDQHKDELGHRVGSSILTCREVLADPSALPSLVGVADAIARRVPVKQFRDGAAAIGADDAHDHDHSTHVTSHHPARRVPLLNPLPAATHLSLSLYMPLVLENRLPRRMTYRVVFKRSRPVTQPMHNFHAIAVADSMSAEHTGSAVRVNAIEPGSSSTVPSLDRLGHARSSSVVSLGAGIDIVEVASGVLQPGEQVALLRVDPVRDPALRVLIDGHQWSGWMRLWNVNDVHCDGAASARVPLIDAAEHCMYARAYNHPLTARQSVSLIHSTTSASVDDSAIITLQGAAAAARHISLAADVWVLNQCGLDLEFGSMCTDGRERGITAATYATAANISLAPSQSDKFEAASVTAVFDASPEVITPPQLIPAQVPLHQHHSVVDVVYENERYVPLVGWGLPGLPTDPYPFSDASGSVECNLESFPLPNVPHVLASAHQTNLQPDAKGASSSPAPEGLGQWHWLDEWHWGGASLAAAQSASAQMDQSITGLALALSDEGWLYARDFSSNFHPGPPGLFDMVRRRAWCRARVFRGHSPTVLLSGSQLMAVRACASSPYHVSSLAGDVGPGSDGASSKGSRSQSHMQARSSYSRWSAPIDCRDLMSGNQSASSRVISVSHVLCHTRHIDQSTAAHLYPKPLHLSLIHI